LGVNLFDLPEGERVVAMDRVAEPSGGSDDEGEEVDTSTEE
jgi:hypothetical protein